MASLLQTIHGAWAGNATLEGALPVTSVYVGLLPENLGLPYGTINVNSSERMAMRPSESKLCSWQVAIYAYDAVELEGIAESIKAVFDSDPFPFLVTLQSSYQVIGREEAGIHVYQAVLDFKSIYEGTL